MTRTFTQGDPVRMPDGTLAEFVKHLPDGDYAVIRVGMDSRIVDPVVLRRVA